MAHGYLTQPPIDQTKRSGAEERDDEHAKSQSRIERDIRGNKSIETNSDTAVASGRRPEAENAKVHKEMQHPAMDGDGPKEEITHRSFVKDELPGASKASEFEESARVNIPLQYKADEEKEKHKCPEQEPSRNHAEGSKEIVKTKEAPPSQKLDKKLIKAQNNKVILQEAKNQQVMKWITSPLASNTMKLPSP